MIRRFRGGERLLHWCVAVDLTLLALSGLGLWLPPSSNPVLDRRDLMQSLHVDAAIALVCIPIVVAALHPGALGRLWREVQWFDHSDIVWLRRVLIPGPLRRARPLPAQGRLNAGQKVNTLLVAAALVGFVVTGCVMYVGAHVPPSWADASDQWHVWLMLLMAPLVGGHIALALAVPSTRGALRGIVTGFVRVDYARRRHARWAAEVAAGASTATGRDDAVPEVPVHAGDGRPGGQVLR